MKVEDLITQRVMALKRKLHQARELAGNRSNLISIVLHDVRNALTPIKSNIELRRPRVARASPAETLPGHHQPRGRPALPPREQLPRPGKD